MAHRHLARSIIMQALFELDFNGFDEARVESALDHSLGEFGSGIDNPDFIRETTRNVVKKRKVLDEIIEKAAPDWPLDKISVTDRNILRLGLYELLFGDREQVPPKVAINEAIELGKSFGGEKSGPFINGVLGAIYKEIGEPGKDQVSKKKRPHVPLDPSQYPVEIKGGAIVFSKDDAGAIRFAMVHDVFGYWTLSKGGIDPELGEIEGTKKKIKEEIGIDITILEKLGENEYIAHHPEKGPIRKHVLYFLAQANYEPLTLKENPGGLDQVKWFEMQEVVDLTMYDDVTQLMAMAIEKIMAI
ncbi:MAG: transcription antitermination factor NusB [bacterium]